MKWRGRGAGSSPQRNPLSPHPRPQVLGYRKPGGRGVRLTPDGVLTASSPARKGLGEPGEEWEELWILEDRVRGVGASWNRKASARAYFAPDGQSQGELLSLSSQQSR